MSTTSDADELHDYIEELQALIGWLAMPYGDNSPIFATSLPNGDLLETGIKMKALYRAVVGEKSWTAGTWVECPTCGQWHVRSELLPELPAPGSQPGVLA